MEPPLHCMNHEAEGSLKGPLAFSTCAEIDSRVWTLRLAALHDKLSSCLPLTDCYIRLATLVSLVQITLIEMKHNSRSRQLCARGRPDHMQGLATVIPTTLCDPSHFLAASGHMGEFTQPWNRTFPESCTFIGRMREWLYLSHYLPVQCVLGRRSRAS